MASNFVPIGITCHCACFKPMKNRHTCICASSREQVDAFYHAALNAGGMTMAVVDNKRLGTVLKLAQDKMDELDRQDKRNRSKSMPRRRAQARVQL